MAKQIVLDLMGEYGVWSIEYALFYLKLPDLNKVNIKINECIIIGFFCRHY